MKKRKLIAGVGLTLAAGLTLTACGTTANEAPEASEGAGADCGAVEHILFDYPFTPLPVYSLMVPEIEKAAEEAGVTVEFTNDDLDLSKQVSNLTTYLSNDDVDAVVSFPMDPASLESIAADYMNKCVYWVTYAGDMENQHASLQFSFYDSGYEMGAYAAEWATETIGDDAQIFILEDQTVQVGIERTAGLVDGITETNPNLEIVAMEQAVTPDEGLSATTTILAQYPDVNVVLAAAGDAAQGGYQALVASGRDEMDANTFVGGLDTSLFGFQKIHEGTFFRALAHLDLFAFVKEVINIPVALGEGVEDASVDFPVEFVTIDTPNLEELIVQTGG